MVVAYIAVRLQSQHLFVVGGDPTFAFGRTTQGTCERRTIGAEILFLDYIVLCDHEGHHTGRPIFRGVSDKAEAIGDLGTGSTVYRGTKVVAVDEDGIGASRRVRCC